MKFFWPYLSNKNPKISNREDTPFHFVTFNGLSDVAGFMIEELSVDDCLTENTMDITPLHHMVTKGHAEIIRSLRRKIDFEFIDPNFFKEILHEAIDYGYLDCIKALLEKQTLSFQSNAVDIAKNYHSRMNQNQYKIVHYLSEEFKLAVVPTFQKN